MEKPYRKTILIDLDGVLNEYQGDFQKDFIPEIKIGAREFLEKLSREYTIKIFTTRNKILTSKWIIKNGLEEYIEDVTNTKDVCFLYIDDRCINFNGNYENLESEIANFKPHWK